MNSQFLNKKFQTDNLVVFQFSFSTYLVMSDLHVSVNFMKSQCLLNVNHINFYFINDHQKRGKITILTIP